MNHLTNLFNDTTHVFDGVKFCTMPPIRNGVKEALVSRGAVDHGSYLNRHVTHLICDNFEFQQHISAEYLKPPEMSFYIASSEWVRWSVLAECQLPTEPFSFFRSRIFEDMIFGVGGDPTFLQVNDKAKLWAMINFYGGRMSSRIDRCTHLIVANCPAGGQIQRQSLTKAILITPNYVVECILSKTRLDENNYNPVDFQAYVHRIPQRSMPLIRTNNMDWWHKLKPKRSHVLNDDANIKMFKGCCFHFIDYEYLYPLAEINRWKDIVRSRGGDIVDDRQNKRFTHLVCENRHSDLYKRALACGGIKLVTSDWLLDVIDQKEQLPPWLPYHYPLVYSQLRRNELPLRRHMVHICGSYDFEAEYILAKMITMLGGIHSKTLTSVCSISISNIERITDNILCSDLSRLNGDRNTCLKVNQRWLVELFFGTELLNVKLLPKYTDPNDQCTVYRFDRIFVSEFFSPWITFDPNSDLLNMQTDSQSLIYPHTKVHKKTQIKQDQPNVQLSYSWRRNELTEDGYVLAFTGFSARQLKELHSIVSRLPEGRIAKDDFEVTHLVAKTFVRTTRLLTCASVCSYVVNYKWILDSKVKGHYIHPPTSEHQINDDSEIMINDLKLSNALKRPAPLFKGLYFFCMPNTKPPSGNLKNPILAAGGICLTDLSQALGNRNSIVLANSDEHLESLMPLIKMGLNVQSTRFILDNLFREDIDFESYQLNELTN
ncbi:hypothetical protein GJ496_009836 [Pomphorhynchus laevis]|nr:hypothetical protein GJ496_009836 [Pomphorhynchus laevis]